MARQKAIEIALILISILFAIIGWTSTAIYCSVLLMYVLLEGKL